MAEGESENFDDVLGDDTVVSIFDMLNFKIVPKKPGDPGYCQFNEVIPPESRLYADEYIRLHDKCEKLKAEMAAMVSRSDLQVRQELTEAKGALARAQTEREEAKKAVSTEQEIVKNLREAEAELRQQLNDSEKKNQEEKEMLEKKLEEALLKVSEKEKEVEESGQINDDLRKQNKEDKENLDKIQKEKEKLEKDLRILTAASSQLQEKSSIAEATNCELQTRLGTLQAKFTDIEKKLEEERTKYKTSLEEATTDLNKQKSELIEAGKSINELRKSVDKAGDLQEKLEQETSKAEEIRRGLYTVTEEKFRVETELTTCRESFQNYDLEVTQFIEELKKSIGLADEDGIDSCHDTMQSKLKSLSAHVQSKLKSNEDNLKELQAELTKANNDKNELLRMQSTQAERPSMPPSPPPPSEKIAVVSLPPSASDSGSSDPQSSLGLGYNIAVSSKDVTTTRSQEQETSTRTSTTASLFADFSPLDEAIRGTTATSSGDTDVGVTNGENMDPKAIPKIKIQQSGENWNIVTPSPAQSIMSDGDENQNINTLMDEMISSSSSPEPLDQVSQDDDQRSSQQPTPLIDVNYSNSVEETTTFQLPKHGIDETKLGDGNYCFCEKKYNTRESLKRHVHYHTLDSIFPCTICGHRFKQPSNLKTHYIRKHKKVVNKSIFVNCKLCGQKFNTREQLKMHQLATHASNPQPSHATGNRSHHRDREDNLEGSQENGLSESINSSIHSSASPGTSYSPHRLQSGITIHGVDISRQDEGAFCICGKQCSSKPNLDAHIGYFTFDWKFECDICSQRFYQLTYLRRHYAETHNDPEKFSKKFNCNVCFQKYTLLSDLQNHLKDVHKATNLRSLSGCQHCGKIFISQEELLNHISLLHPGAVGSPKHRTRSSTALSPKLTAEPELMVPPTSSSQHLEIDISHIKIENIDPQLEAMTDENTAAVKHGVDYSKTRLGFYCKCEFKSSGQFAKYNLKKHINYFNASSHFECPQCQLSFKSTYRVKRHMRCVHNLDYTLVGCSTCGKVFQNIKVLRKHKKSQRRCGRNRKQILKIDLTNIQTPAPHREEEYLEELQQDAEIGVPASQITTQQEVLPTSSIAETLFTIAQSMPLEKSTTKKVPSSLSSRKPLSLPKKKHAKDTSKRNLGFFCICGMEKRNEAGLNGHITYFNSGKKFECELCGHRSLYLAQLKRHLKSVHKLTDSHQLRQMGMGCSLCGERGFATRKELTIHEMAEHSVLNDPKGQSASNTGNQTACVEPQPSTSKGLPVPTNDMVSLNSGYLRNRSTVILTRSLSTTRVASTSPKSLLKNINQADTWHAIDITKSNEGLFVCICGYTSNCRPNLASHISYMTLKKRYVCPICEKKFVFMSVLRKHAKRSHRKHLSVGSTCSKAISSKVELFKHKCLSMRTQSIGLQAPAPQQQPMLSLPSIPTTSKSLAVMIEQAEYSVVNGSIGATLPNIPLSSHVKPSSYSSSSTCHVEPSSSSTSHVEPSSSSSHVEPSSPSSPAAAKRSDETEEDMIIDAHLTYEPCVSQVQHKINHEMLPSHFFCVCGQDFANLSALNNHVECCSSDGKFICKTCGQGFLLAYYLRSHMLRVHKIVYSIFNGCTHCGKSFSTNMQLYEHFKKEHNNGQKWENKYIPPTTISKSCAAEVPT